mmetsp:Transcript_22506/g.38858  ORF Transcript_22506/g.38858 Transcript_22506/m.38858 type:complete len:267 (+) Transcript_22506:182-982(+)
MAFVTPTIVLGQSPALSAFKFVKAHKYPVARRQGRWNISMAQATAQTETAPEESLQEKVKREVLAAHFNSRPLPTKVSMIWSKLFAVLVSLPVIAQMQRSVQKLILYVRKQAWYADMTAAVAQAIEYIATHPVVSEIKAKWVQFLIYMGFTPTEEHKSAMEQLKKYGPAAIVAYGMFDAVTYSLSFMIALFSLKGFAASSASATTGAAAANPSLAKVLALMWGINNFSRPFRIAGALLLAPKIDEFVIQPIRNLAKDLRKPKSEQA